MEEKSDIRKNSNLKEAKKLPGGGYEFEANDDFINHMMESDKPECKYKRGDRVEKATYESGDIHKIGTKGVVMGTIFNKEIGEGYLVQFENDPNMSFTMQYKIKLLKDGV
jgi:hypothetical protein